MGENLLLQLLHFHNGIRVRIDGIDIGIGAANGEGREPVR